MGTETKAKSGRIGPYRNIYREMKKPESGRNCAVFLESYSEYACCLPPLPPPPILPPLPPGETSSPAPPLPPPL